MNESRTPGWMRGVQIGLGVIAIILSILVLVHPGITVVSIIIVIGREQVTLGQCGAWDLSSYHSRNNFDISCTHDCFRVNLIGSCFTVYWYSTYNTWSRRQTKSWLGKRI